MNLIIDIGNTQFKVCIFSNNQIIYHAFYDKFTQKHYNRLLEDYTINQIVYSDTRGINSSEFEKIFDNKLPILALSHTIKLPVRIEYKTPETLGKDRIAGVVGAAVVFPDQHCLVIDVGTAITIDYINDKAVFKGGIISPGPEIRFKSLNMFTGKLPLLKPTDTTKHIGDSTQTAIQYGVQNGIAYEINGYISRFMQECPQLKIILTGGYANLFDKKINYPIFADSFLVPKGLNRILVYNELQK